MKKYIASFIFLSVLVFNVKDLCAGSVTLSWDAPSQNTDGTPLIIGGYRVYYGTYPGYYLHVVDTGSNATTYKIDDLDAGATYYFAVTAYDNEGIESQYSNETSVTMAIPFPDLIVSRVSNPPRSKIAGSSFMVRDTVKNAGGEPAPASVTRYYLSRDTSKNRGDIALRGNRRISWLDPEETSSGSAKVAIPSKARTGRYYVLSCADGNHYMDEFSEVNNCTASRNRIRIRK